MNRFIKSRKMRYGGVALFLTILVIAAVIIINMITASLAGRYDWMYLDMNSEFVYDISDNYKEYISEFVIPEIDDVNSGLSTAENQKIKFVFCDDKENIISDRSQKYIHDSIYELKDIFDGYIEVDYLDIWENPSEARQYDASATTDIICIFNGKHETVNVADFYIYADDGSSAVTSYNGEKILASCIMRVTQKETPVCYFTANHGENFGDYEFMRSVVEAGYTLAFLDLSAEDIPEDCALLVTFAPKQDLAVSNEISSISEIDKLNAYMNNGGKYMVFMSADSFASGSRENFESFLSDWGIKYMHENGDDGVENCYLIKDRLNSTSIDGYTVISQNVTQGIGGEVMSDLGSANIFGNTTCIEFSDGFMPDGQGNHIKTVDENKRIASPLMVSHSSAEAWAGGRAVARAADDPFVLMSITVQTCKNGEQACLVASASTEFAGQEAMSSAVLSNSRTVTGIFKYLGRYNAPIDLVFKPFGSTDIESLSTHDANVITVTMTVIPAVLFTAIGAIVLIRRKHS